MALLNLTGFLHLFLMVYTQVQAQTSAATPAVSTATPPASTAVPPTGTTNAAGTTQFVSSSAASDGTTATLSSTSGAPLITASLSSTVSTITTTISPTLSTITTPFAPTLSTITTTISPTLSTVTTTISPTLSTITTTISPTLSTITTTISPTLSTITTTISPTLSTITTTISPTLSTITTTISPTLSTITTTISPTLSTNIAASSTIISSNDTSSAPTGTTASPNMTSTNTTSLSSTALTQTNTTVSPNVTTSSQPNTTDSLNDTVTNNTDASGSSTPSATTESTSGTASLSPPATSTISPTTTATTTPTRSPQGNTVVMMLTAVYVGYHPAKVNLTLDNVNRWSTGLCDAKTIKSVINLKITSGSDYFYHVDSITEATGTANPGSNFICMVDDLPNLSTRFYGTITCARDSQSCTSGNGAGTCASAAMVTNQCSVSFLWPSDQTVTIVYHPNVLSFTCSGAKISCSSSSETPIAETAASGDSEKGHSGVILGVILSILVVVIALGLAFVWWRQRNSKQRGSVQFHNDGSQPKSSKPVGLRLGEKRTLQRLQSSNSDDTEFEFTSVNLSPAAPSPQATIDLTSGQKLYSQKDSTDSNSASGAHHKYAINDQESGENSQRVSNVYDLPTDDRKSH